MFLRKHCFTFSPTLLPRHKIRLITFWCITMQVFAAFLSTYTRYWPIRIIFRYFRPMSEIDWRLLSCHSIHATSDCNWTVLRLRMSLRVLLENCNLNLMIIYDKTHLKRTPGEEASDHFDHLLPLLTKPLIFSTFQTIWLFFEVYSPWVVELILKVDWLLVPAILQITLIKLPQFRDFGTRSVQFSLSICELLAWSLKVVVESRFKSINFYHFWLDLKIRKL